MINSGYPVPPPRRSRSGSASPVIQEDVTSTPPSSRGASPKRLRIHGPSTSVTSRDTALYLAGETLATAATQWLVEEAFRSKPCRASNALKFASDLLRGNGLSNSCAGRRGAGMLDEVRRVLVAAQPSSVVYVGWARPGTTSYRRARLNYASWDPEISVEEWEEEIRVFTIIRDAIVEAVKTCHVHLYAPIVTVASTVADKAAEIAVQLDADHSRLQDHVEQMSCE